MDRRPGRSGRLQPSRPQLLGDVRRRRRQHQQGETNRLVPLGRARDGRAAITHQDVRQLHQLGDHRVEVERLVVGGHVAQRPVGGLADRETGVRIRLTRGQRPALGIARLASGRVEHDRPDAAQESMDAADAGRAPRATLVPRAHEHQEQPNGVGAVAGDQFVRVLGVAPGLRHPLAVHAQDLALVEQALERLVLLEDADVPHHLRPLAGVEQMHDRVLGAAGVLLHRRPPLGEGAVERRARLLWR